VDSSPVCGSHAPHHGTSTPEGAVHPICLDFAQASPNELIKIYDTLVRFPDLAAQQVPSERSYLGLFCSKSFHPNERPDPAHHAFRVKEAGHVGPAVLGQAAEQDVLRASVFGLADPIVCPLVDVDQANETVWLADLEVARIQPRIGADALPAVLRP
jgi:hypothetical protein